MILTRALDLELGLNEILVSYCVIYSTVITRSKTIFSSVDIPKFISTEVHSQGSSVSSGQKLTKKW